MTLPDTIDIPESQALNMRLGEVEFALGRAALRSLPRNLTIVIGDGCNIDCPHCYQMKTGDNLFRDAEIGATLRREIAALYPYVSTVRVQGGEVFALRGFRELVDDIAAFADRPLISISTNGTLISEDWAERMVSMPFQNVTVSLDAGTRDTFAKVRRGADFGTVIGNIRRLNAVKARHNSAFPTLDSFFVIMRSNFREIPQFLELLRGLGIYRASFQTMLVDARNLGREPGLRDEELTEKSEVEELFDILVREVQAARKTGMQLVWSGLHTLFEKNGLDPGFLQEGANGLTPGHAKNAGEEPAGLDEGLPAYRMPPVPDLPEGIVADNANAVTCTNPWYTMFVTENGDVSLCFLSEPVGNLFETPLIEIWNSPAAIAKRSRMLAGRVTESGCSRLWCDWRDGAVSDPPSADTWRELLSLFTALHHRLAPPSAAEEPDVDRKLRNIRRLMTEKNQRIAELEANLALMWQDNAELHEAGQNHIDALEAQLEALRGF